MELYRLTPTSHLSDLNTICKEPQNKFPWPQVIRITCETGPNWTIGGDAQGKAHRNYQRVKASATDKLNSALRQLISFKAIQLHHMEPLRVRVTQWSAIWKDEPKAEACVCWYSAGLTVIAVLWVSGFTVYVKGIALWKLDLIQNTLSNFFSALHVVGLFAETRVFYI